MSSEMKWMPIETAPDGKEVLTYSRWSGTDILFRNGDYWFYSNQEPYKNGDILKKTHWMGLPTPPETE